MTTRNCPFSCSAALNRATRSRILSNGPVQLLLLGICVLGSKHSELSSQFIIQPLLCFVTSKEILSHLVVELANYDLLSLCCFPGCTFLLSHTVLIFCWLGFVTNKESSSEVRPIVKTERRCWLVVPFCWSFPGGGLLCCADLGTAIPSQPMPVLCRLSTWQQCQILPSPPLPSFAMLLRILLLVCTGGGQCTCLVQSHFGIAHPWQGPDRFPCPIALKAIAGCSVACTKHDVCNGIASQPVWWVRNLAHRTNFSGRPGFQPFKLLTSTRN